MIDKYRVLIKKNEIIDKGVRTKDQGDLSNQEQIIAIGNIVVRKEKREVSGDLVMLSEKLIIDKINTATKSAITNAHKQIAGSVEFDIWADFEQAKTDWDNGQGIYLTDGDGNTIYYTKDVAKVGDIIIVSSSKTRDDVDYFYPEEVAIKDGHKNAELFTHNNEYALAFKDIDVFKQATNEEIGKLKKADKKMSGDIDRIQLSVDDKVSTSNFNNSQKGQDDEIAENTIGITVLDTRVRTNESKIENNKREIDHIKKDIPTINKWSGDVKIKKERTDVTDFEGNVGKFSYHVGDRIDIIVKLDGVDREFANVLTVNGTPIKITADGKTLTLDLQLEDGTNPGDDQRAVVIATLDTGKLNKWHIMKAIQTSADLVISKTYSTDKIDEFLLLKADKTTVDTLTSTVNNKQNKQDNSLNTTSKSIVGGINDNKANIDKKANKDLSNVNVGTAHAGKVLQVKADGTLEYSDIENKLPKLKILKFDRDDIPFKWTNETDPTKIEKQFNTLSGSLSLSESSISGWFFNDEFVIVEKRSSLYGVKLQKTGMIAIESLSASDNFIIKYDENAKNR